MNLNWMKSIALFECIYAIYIDSLFLFCALVLVIIHLDFLYPNWFSLS